MKLPAESTNNSETFGIFRSFCYMESLISECIYEMCFVSGLSPEECEDVLLKQVKPEYLPVFVF